MGSTSFKASRRRMILDREVVVKPSCRACPRNGALSFIDLWAEVEVSCCDYVGKSWGGVGDLRRFFSAG